jgi:hypothetical protein
MKKAEKVAWYTAWRNIETMRRIVSKIGWKEDADDSLAERIHDSHLLKTVRHGQAVYCTRCACWSEGRRAEGLAAECKFRIADGSRNALRLLQLGVLPKRGARIPGGLLRSHRRLRAMGSRGSAKTIRKAGKQERCHRKKKEALIPAWKPRGVAPRLQPAASGMPQAKRPRLKIADQTTTSTDLEPVSEEAAHRELLELRDSGLSVRLPRIASPPAIKDVFAENPGEARMSEAGGAAQKKRLRRTTKPKSEDAAALDELIEMQQCGLRVSLPR